MKSIGLTKEFLIREYIENSKSTVRIAQELNVGSACINYNLHKFNIPIRPTSLFGSINTIEFVDLFKSKTAQEVGDFYGVSDRTIYEWANKLKQKGVVVLSNREYEIEQIPKELTSEQEQLIDGSMLGDGCIWKPMTNTCECGFSEKHCMQQAEYLGYKAKILGSLVSEVRNQKQLASDYYVETTARVLISKFCPIFTKLEKRWYKRDELGSYILNKNNNHRIKIVPRDIKLTPFSAAIWFQDDGWNDAKRKTAGFCTNCFNKGDVEVLLNQLDLLSIKHFSVVWIRSQPVIHVLSKSYIDFIDMISPHVVVECMKYKVDTSQYIPSKKLNTSGCIGVSYNVKYKKWGAYISINTEKFILGYYDNKEDAFIARKLADKLRNEGIVDKCLFLEIKEIMENKNENNN